MKVLIACEESQEVCKAFRELGHEAYSCDLEPCSGGHPEWHIQDSIWHVLGKPGTQYPLQWDLIIGHPPCTFLSNSGARWLYNKDGSINTERWNNMVEGSIFFRSLMYSNCDKICIENPIIHKHAVKIIGRKQDQIIQPWQFGHGETKATCLWLKGLPLLVPTDIVEGREQRIAKMPPSKDRQKLRSKTYPGIAAAFADQYSRFIESGMSVNEWWEKVLNTQNK
jgi:hypothetical protein